MSIIINLDNWEGQTAKHIYWVFCFGYKGQNFYFWNMDNKNILNICVTCNLAFMLYLHTLTFLNFSPVIFTSYLLKIA